MVPTRPCSRAASCFAGGKLAVVAVPTQDFNQELGTNEAVKKFCADKGAKYNVMGLCHVLVPAKEQLAGEPAAAAEATVQNADQVEPLMRFLQHATNERIKWNFHKFVVGADGVPIVGMNSRGGAEAAVRSALGLDSSL